MFGIGGVEVILFTLILWALGIWAAYWLIRVGVRHGTLDALRQDRLEQERRSAARESRPLP